MRIKGHLQVEDVVDDMLDDLQLGQLAFLWNSGHELLQLGQERLHFLTVSGSLANLRRRKLAARLTTRGWGDPRWSY